MCWVFWREGNSVDRLGEGLAPQHHLLLSPVPKGQHVVGCAAHTGQQRAVRAEVHVTVC